MRILSSRIARARRERRGDQVEAIVSLTVLSDGTPIQAYIRVAAPAHAKGAATLRARLLASAKLTFAADPQRHAHCRAA